MNGHSLLLCPDCGPQVHTVGQLHASVHGALLFLASPLSWLFYVVLFEYCLFSFTLSPTSTSVGTDADGFYVCPQTRIRLGAYGVLGCTYPAEPSLGHPPRPSRFWETGAVTPTVFLVLLLVHSQHTLMGPGRPSINPCSAYPPIFPQDCFSSVLTPSPLFSKL